VNQKNIRRRRNKNKIIFRVEEQKELLRIDDWRIFDFVMTREDSPGKDKNSYHVSDIEYFAYVNNQRQRGELTKGNHQVIDIAQL
jgi:ribosomal 30S subunit maturation factor RimM